MKYRLIVLLLLLLLPMAQPQADQQYHRRASTLSIQKRSNQGLFVWLTDGSAWELRHLDRERAASWSMERKIVIYKTSDAEYPYRLQYDPTGEVPDMGSARYLKRL